MRRSLFFALLGGLIAACAHAQQAQFALHINDPALAGQYLSVTDKTGLEPPGGYTIEAWVNPTVTASFPTIVGNDYHSSYWLGLGTSNRVRFYPIGGAGLYFEGATSLPLNRWTHVAATYNSVTGSAIYLNGVLDATNVTILGPVGTSAGDLRIGADREGGSAAYFWQGGLDEIRIWDVARSATDIAFNYRVGQGRRTVFVSGWYDHLQALWDMTLPFTTATPDVSGAPAFHVANFVGGDYHMTGEPGPPTSDNTALELEGGDDHAILPMPDGFSAGLTISAWVAPRSFTGFPTIAGRDFRTSFWLGINPSGQLRFYPTGGVGQFFESPVSLALGHWAHVAATYRPGLASLYINGELVASTTAFTTPVGENGRDVWIGADNEAGVAGTPLPFVGELDEVEIARGAWTGPDIAFRRFEGFENLGQPEMLADYSGTPRETWSATFGQREGGYYTVAGASAHLVRSGAPMIAFGMDIGALSIYADQINWQGGYGTLPNDQTASSITSNVSWPTGIAANSVQVFLAAPDSSLEHTHVRLHSPAGTWVDLMNPGDAVGMDLHTNFSDGSPNTFATSYAPYYDGVRPHSPLAAFSATNAQGTWTLEMTSDGSPACLFGLWAWGLQISGPPVGVEDRTPHAFALRNTGANPVRGSGAVAFGLAKAADLDLSLYDAQGRAVRTLLAGRRAAGEFALGWSAAGLEPGAYFLRLRVGGEQTSSLKVMVVK